MTLRGSTGSQPLSFISLMNSSASRPSALLNAAAVPSSVRTSPPRLPEIHVVVLVQRLVAVVLSQVVAGLSGDLAHGSHLIPRGRALDPELIQQALVGERLCGLNEDRGRVERAVEPQRFHRLRGERAPVAQLVQRDQ